MLYKTILFTVLLVLPYISAQDEYPSIYTDKEAYISGNEIEISFDIGGFDVATKVDWIGLFPYGVIPSVTSTDWQYLCGGTDICDSPVEKGSVTFTTELHNSKWAAWYMSDDGGRTYKASTTFSVSGWSCKDGTGDISPNTHIYASGDLEVTKIAFSSCIKPRTISDTTFWGDVREFEPDLWLWLGDNAYSNGIDMNYKRSEYNLVRDEPSYSSHGLVKPDAKIPVMGTWDDHDFAFDNHGNDYLCPKQSQDEYVVHFNIPATDPRHKDYPDGQQAGIYNARMFPQPGTSENGIHVIMLDARYDRDPTYSNFGKCKGAESHMLSDIQWEWLDAELEETSVVKVIASGTQVLQPTNLEMIQKTFCADDSHSQGDTTTFIDSIKALGEDGGWYGTGYESWGEMPQQRLKLLSKVQKAINSGKAKVVVFTTGDQHWAELFAKRMPESSEFGASQTLYEVTASGIYQNFPYEEINSNRLRDRSCDHEGSGPYNAACVFPWTYKGETYTDCASPDEDAPWCSTKTDASGNHVGGHWGFCGPKEDELAQETFSNSTHTCDQSKYRICSAAANYGTITVDFQNKKVMMGLRTPDEKEQAYHIVSYQ